MCRYIVIHIVLITLSVHAIDNHMTLCGVVMSSVSLNRFSGDRRLTRRLSADDTSNRRRAKPEKRSIAHTTPLHIHTLTHIPALSLRYIWTNLCLVGWLCVGAATEARGRGRCQGGAEPGSEEHQVSTSRAGEGQQRPTRRATERSPATQHRARTDPAALRAVETSGGQVEVSVNTFF